MESHTLDHIELYVKLENTAYENALNLQTSWKTSLHESRKIWGEQQEAEQLREYVTGRLHDSETELSQHQGRRETINVALAIGETQSEIAGLQAEISSVEQTISTLNNNFTIKMEEKEGYASQLEDAWKVYRKKQQARREVQHNAEEKVRMAQVNRY